MDSGLAWANEIESCFREVTTSEKVTKKGFKRSGLVVEYDPDDYEEPRVSRYEYQVYHSSDIEKTACKLYESGFKTTGVKRFVTYLSNPKTGEVCYLALKTGIVEFVQFEECI